MNFDKGKYYQAFSNSGFKGRKGMLHAIVVGSR